MCGHDKRVEELCGGQTGVVAGMGRGVARWAVVVGFLLHDTPPFDYSLDPTKPLKPFTQPAVTIHKLTVLNRLPYYRHMQN